MIEEFCAICVIEDYAIPFDEVQNNFDEETSLQPLLFNLLDEQMLPPEEKIKIEENRFTVFLSGSKMIQGTDSMVKF